MELTNGLKGIQDRAEAVLHRDNEDDDTFAIDEVAKLIIALVNEIASRDEQDRMRRDS